MRREKRIADNKGITSNIGMTNKKGITSNEGMTNNSVTFIRQRSNLSASL